MASLSRLIKEKGEEIGGIKTEQVKVQQIHYSKLKSSRFNFYNKAQEEVRELADNMLIVGGILEPLIVRKTDFSEYEILAGHKRKAASLFNVERGYPQYEFLPCIVIDVGSLMSRKISEDVIMEAGENGNEQMLDMIAEYIVICTNSTAREISPYEKMMQSVRLMEILPAMLEDGDLKGRALRAEVAKEMKCGDGQVGRYQAIYNRLVPDAMRLFRDNAISITIASGMSGLSEERQQELIESGNITSEEIERLRELEKEEKEKQKVCEGQLTFEEEAVSESDTEIEQEDIDVVEEVVSESDTEFDPDDYEKVAWSDEIGAEINRRICELVFDDDNFPKEVMEELTAKENREAEYFRSIMRVALPFETDRIRLEYDFGFKSYFKDDMTVITVPLWKIWVYFADRYKLYAQSKSDTVIPDSSTSAQDGETPRFKVINNRGYCKPDVEQLLSQYKGMVRNIESQIQSQNASKGDIQNLQKATIIQDALEYFLDNYDEVREKYLKS